MFGRSCHVDNLPQSGAQYGSTLSDHQPAHSLQSTLLLVHWSYICTSTSAELSTGIMSLQQAQAEGLCLKYPEPLGPHPQITQEAAVHMLQRAIQLSQHTPFAWGYIDKPTGTCEVAHIPGSCALTVAEGTAFLIFQTPQLPFPIDGLIYQDREQRYNIPVGTTRVSVYHASDTFTFFELRACRRNSK